MGTLARLARGSAQLAACALIGACASTTVTVTPAAQAPLCDRSATAIILWAPHWRPEQKDVAAREAAAASGLADFLATSQCFARAELKRVRELTPTAVQAALDRVGEPLPRVVGVEVRELGPVVKLLSSVLLVEGGTEVVLRLVEYSPRPVSELRQFTVHWANGGPGMVKGVSGLPGDMQSALRSAFQADGAEK